MNTIPAEQLASTVWTEANAYQLRITLQDVLRAGTQLPDETLLQLEAALRPHLHDSAATIVHLQFGRALGEIVRAYEVILMLLARQQVSDARELILNARANCPEVADEAAKALTVLAGLPDPQDFIRSRVEEVGEEGLTENQKLFYHVYQLRWSEVIDLLILDFGEGDEARDSEECFEEQEQRNRYMAKGLRAIGAHATAEIFEGAWWGKGSFDALEECLCYGEPILGLMYDFARAHPDEFRPMAE